MFLKSIKVKYINTPKLTIIPLIKRKTDKTAGNSFPDRYYSMNYRYNGNKHKISMTEGNIESLEQNIYKQYIDIKHKVEDDYVKYSSKQINENNIGNYEDIIEYL